MTDKAKQSLKAYTSSKPAYTGGRYYDPGEVFLSGAKKGSEWELVSADDKAAIDASQLGGAGDPSLEAMDLKSLQALAAEKKVTVTGLDKKALITAIRAADEPTL